MKRPLTYPFILFLFVVATAGNEGWGQPEKDYEFAVRLFQAEKYDLALEKFRAFTQAYPDHELTPRAAYHLGHCLAKLEQYAEAAKAFQDFVTKYPTYNAAEVTAEAARYNVGFFYYQAGDYLQAEAGFADYLQQAQDEKLQPMAHYWRGECLYNLKRLPEAIQSYQQVLKSENDYVPHALYSIGVCQAELGRPQEALTAFERFLEQFPNSELRPEIHWRIGEALVDLERYDEALVHFQQVPADHDFAPEALLGLGIAHQLKGDLQVAAEAFQDFAQKFPQHDLLAEARFRRGTCLLQLKQFEAARKAFEGVLKIPNTSLAPDALLGLAETYSAQEQYDQAIQTLQDFLQKFPDQAGLPRVRLLLANVYLQQEQYEQALPLYQQYLDHPAEETLTVEALYNLGLCFYRLKRMDEAAATFEKFRGQFPRHDQVPGVLVELGNYYLAQEQFDRARERFDEVLKEWPQNPAAKSALFGLGMVAERQEQYEEALKRYRAFLEAYPEDPLAQEARIALAEINEKLGHPEEARKTWAELLEKDPTAAAPGLLRAAVQAFNQKQYEEALSVCDTLLAKLPADHADLPTTQAIRAASFYNLGRFAEASRAYGELAERHPGAKEAEEALFWKARAERQSNRKEAAIASFRAFLEAHPDHPQARSARTELADLLGPESVDEAILELRRAIEAATEPATKASLIYKLGWLFKDAGRAEEANVEFQRLVAEHPTHELAGYALVHLADYAYDQEQYLRAEELYRQFLEQFPEHKLRGRAWHFLGWALRRQEKEGVREAFAEAEKIYSQNVQANLEAENLGQAYLDLGWVRLDLENYAAAAEAFREAAARLPAGELKEEALFRLGFCLYRASDYQAAQDTLQSFHNTYGNSKFHPEALFYLAQVKSALAGALEKPTAAAWEQAAADYRLFLERYPDHTLALEARFNLAVALQRQATVPEPPADKADKLKEALTTYDQVIQQTETEMAAEAQFHKGECLFHQAQYKQALEEFLRVALLYAYDRWTAQAQYMVGVCYRQLNQPEEAAKELRQAEKLFTQLLGQDKLTPEVAAEARYYLGLTYEQLGAADQAKAAWEQVVADYPGTLWAKRARQRLAGE